MMGCGQKKLSNCGSRTSSSGSNCSATGFVCLVLLVFSCLLPNVDALDVLARRSKVIRWDNDALVTVYYAEFLLAEWVINEKPWNTYHSGLAFHNEQTGQKALFEFTPEDPSSVIKILVPNIINNSLLELALGNVAFTWN